LDNSGRDFGSFAEMSGVFGGILRGWDWNRSFDIERDISTDRHIDPMLDFACVPGSERPAPP
jgi:hypothetical protein